MILLLGGTSDTMPIAARLAECGYLVLVSQATEIFLNSPATHHDIEIRCGPLDEASFASLIAQRGIKAVIDASHPYATGIRLVARRAAQAAGIPCLRLARPAAIPEDTPGISLVDDHASAAALAFSFGPSVLATIGTRHLAPYAAESQRTGIALLARVLDHADSISACHALKIPANRVLPGRGPFSLEENRRQMREHGIGVLVTKDGGLAGGVGEKLAAASSEGCHVVVIRRPMEPSEGVFENIETLLATLRRSV